MGVIEITTERKRRLTRDELLILRRCLDVACANPKLFDVVNYFAEIDTKLKALIAASATDK